METVIILIVITIGFMIFRSYLLKTFDSGGQIKAFVIVIIALAFSACLAASTLQEAYQAGFFR